MIDRLIEKLQIFTDKLDLSLKCTNRILLSAKNDQWDLLQQESVNRERLLDIIAKEQEGIESYINALFSEDLTPNNINIIKSWAFDTQNWINSIALRDDEIIECLNESKDGITREIATVFKSKAAFRGYNLNDVRK